MWKADGKNPLARPGRRLVNNCKMGLEEIVWVVWIGLIWLKIGSSGYFLCRR
jgi:hypothetical protein